MLKSVSVQCRSCRLHQRRGGTVLPAEMQCVRLEDSETAQVVTRMLQVFAADGRCPEHAPFEYHPDAYLSEDLEPVELVHPARPEN